MSHTQAPRRASQMFDAPPLDVLERSFRLLVAGPRALAVHGARIGCGLPARMIALDELRSMLLHPSMGYAAREEIWRTLVRHARSDGAAWVVGAAGVALPGLRSLAGQLARDYAGEAADVDAEMLTGFVHALHTIDIRRDRIPARLCYAAFNAGRRWQRRELAHAARRDIEPHSAVPLAPFGHPDFVLARAVRGGVITHLEAELIGDTRLERIPLEAVAAHLGLGYRAAWARRSRAEERLVAALHAELAQEN